MDEILDAKRKLYYLLMKLSEEDITDNEIEIMYLLSRDRQIQNLLNNN